MKLSATVTPRWEGVVNRGEATHRDFERRQVKCNVNYSYAQRHVFVTFHDDFDKFLSPSAYKRGVTGQLQILHFVKWLCCQFASILATFFVFYG